MGMKFLKMNGCGNDFVIFDTRAGGQLPLTPSQIRAISNRERGIGCDTVIAIEPSMRGDAFMRIWNADGSEVSACGNATRCVGWILMDENGRHLNQVKIETLAGMLHAKRAEDELITVDMGSPLLRWEEVPVREAADTVGADIGFGPFMGHFFERPGLVNMGNPHAVFVVDDAMAVPAGVAGPAIENDGFFPQKTNVGFAQVLGPNKIRLRVWERGVGLTKACGTGACAAVVALHRKGILGRKVEVQVDGGTLYIDWDSYDDRIRMTGPVEVETIGVC
jgi:diaminopimelate epimerase